MSWISWISYLPTFFVKEYLKTDCYQSLSEDSKRFEVQHQMELSRLLAGCGRLSELSSLSLDDWETPELSVPVEVSLEVFGGELCLEEH